MLRQELSIAISAAVARLVASGKLPAEVADLPVEVIDTKQPEHGDYACNFAMVAAKPAGMRGKIVSPGWIVTGKSTG